MKNKTAAAYQRIYLYSRPYLGRIFTALAASLLVAGTDVSMAKLVQPLFDTILKPGNNHLVYWVPVMVVSLAILKGISRFVQGYFIKTAGQLAVQDIRNDLYQHTMSLSMRHFSQDSTGNLMSRTLNDVGMLQNSATDVVVDGVRESFTLAGLTVLAFYNDWRLASIAFLVLPLAIVPGSFIGRRIKMNTRHGQNTIGNLTRLLQETLSGIKVIKAFGTERREVDNFRQENQQFYHFIRKVMKYDSAAAPAVEILASFGISAVFWYGIHRVLSGAMTQGELFSFVAAILMMYTPVKRLTRVNNNIQRAVGAAERVFEVLDVVPEICDAPDAVNLGRVRGEIEFAKVGFAYEKEAVIRELSLKIAPGEVVALVGPSGGGKSTVVGLLSRFYDPQHGIICIDDQDIRQATLDSLKRNIALVDQETFLFNDSIRNNIRYGRPEATDAEVEEAAKQAYADDFIRDLPEGYDNRIGDRGARLSGGQRQRLCIARAILRNAPILLLDEATSALDTESEAMVQKALTNLMKNRTTIVVAHRLSTVMHADKIAVLEDGQVQEIGRHNELLNANGPYQRLYEMQFKEQQST